MAAVLEKKTSELPKKALGLAVTDRFMIYNPTTGKTEYVTPAEMQTYLLGTDVTVGGTDDGDIVSVAETQALKAKALDSTCSVSILDNEVATDVYTDKLVTVNAVQTLTNKTLTSPTITGVATLTGTTLASPTLTDPAITGATTIGTGAVFTSPTINTPAINTPSITAPAITGTSTIGDGCTLTTPLLVAPKISGAMTVQDGAILTTPIIASLKQAAGKTLIMPAPTASSDTLVSLTNTQTLTNKTLTTGTVITGATITDGTMGGATLTGVAIDATSTLNGTAVSTALGEKADAKLQVTHTAYLTVTTTDPGTTGTITAAQIFTALGLTINGTAVSEANHYILPRSVVPVLYLNDAGDYVAVACGISTNPTLTITLSGSALATIALASLTTDSEYSVALTFKIAALA